RIAERKEPEARSPKQPRMHLVERHERLSPRLRALAFEPQRGQLTRQGPTGPPSVANQPQRPRCRLVPAGQRGALETRRRKRHVGALLEGEANEAGEEGVISEQQRHRRGGKRRRRVALGSGRVPDRSGPLLQAEKELQVGAPDAELTSD